MQPLKLLLLFSECQFGKYGGNCSSDCSGHCKGVNRFACNYKDGSCSDGCADGWRGPNCENGNAIKKVNYIFFFFFFFFFWHMLSSTVYNYKGSSNRTQVNATSESVSVVFLLFFVVFFLFFCFVFCYHFFIHLIYSLLIKTNEMFRKNQNDRI